MQPLQPGTGLMVHSRSSSSQRTYLAARLEHASEAKVYAAYCIRTVRLYATSAAKHGQCSASVGSTQMSLLIVALSNVTLCAALAARHGAHGTSSTATPLRGAAMLVG